MNACLVLFKVVHECASCSEEPARLLLPSLCEILVGTLTMDVLDWKTDGKETSWQAVIKSLNVGNLSPVP